MCEYYVCVYVFVCVGGGRGREIESARASEELWFERGTGGWNHRVSKKVRVSEEEC